MLLFLAAACLAPAPALAPLPPVLAPVAALAAQDDVVDKRADIKQLLEAFKGHVKKRGDEDSQAIAIIEQLLGEWETCGPKDRGAIVKTLSASLREKRKEIEEGVPNDGLFRAVAVALGEMGGEDCAKELAGWIDHKYHRDNLSLQRELILSLGTTREERAVKPLVDLLDHRQPTVQGAAAEALGQFRGFEGDVRKEIFEAILKQLVPLHTRMQNDTRADPILRNRYDTVSGPMITSLRQLSGLDSRDPVEFQRWWNKNKREDWDEPS